MSTLKEQKQLFVSDLVGGSLAEIYQVVAVSTVAYLAFKVFSSSEFIGNSILLDFLLNVVSLLTSITIYSNSIDTLYGALVAPVAVAGTMQVLLRLKSKKSRNPSKKAPINTEVLHKKAFLTAYRSHMLILTNFAILAVDFHVFPRRFAKVETWGTSIMDMGVGSFVFSMGLVNSRSIIKSKINSMQPNSFGLSKYLSLIFTNFKATIPMLAFGIIRFVSVKGLEYQEHVTEYGIHWNFFITLGLLPTFIAILDPLFELVPRALVAFLIAATYELALCNTGLLQFILWPENRLDSLVTMNKEGLFSFFGYLSIFIFGQSFGSFVLTGRKTPNNLIGFNLQHKSPKSWLTVSTVKGLVISTVFYQSLGYFVKESPLFFNISRRLANLPYVFMIVAYNSFFLLCYCLCNELIGDNDTHSQILEAVNKNGLVYFLLGNLLTGLINMSINTLECDTKTSFLILLVYGIVTIFLVVGLDKRHIYIKL
ncbi:Glucosaminyl phosphatidylinositol (GlcN-PI) nositol acylation protein [Yamadazyma tenuis]|uniref:GPI-anchored wall transfer protein n=1 Tax=Candida tenuis (strain ATCC 10573 / BCRC 21748 / CBS 615 / JCM 9827 / NBRC 10315 / NRRL Y-1498 / VKM Y-70) TaxID=590646 RepID=G3BBZ2_CANTC|nr:GPI-anchored wall transfer protein 1 [Yamadazyma tenuis ATCC 10573]XP_006690226.1 uncharacterized protein CANTEDRAFT_116137 [Yamadazyma tenuis ATCC 10573]EGV61011.1 GPI-anchored wall transfer protein 1 [Yamadazyma tenuis ATCC 10573]EGV61012.1 hypothetical protein CANTEDRAFT_116137 [Yamadazyma tenuis ATCC 10573]WEJ94649.1 Glucosaminyl phosphatidylinositol (GlcN-PI) nositol acylation protein [Yamadazyma tenuis]